MNYENHINADKPQAKKTQKSKVLGILKNIGLSLLAVTTIAGGVTVKGLRTFNNDLIKEQVIEQNFDELGAKDEVSGWNDRFVFPEDGVVKVNIRIPKEKITNEVKQGLFDAVFEINSMLSIVNPNYRLELNYEPKALDNLYCFNVYDDDYSGSEAAGTAQTKIKLPTINGYGKYSVRIGIDLNKINGFSDKSSDIQTAVKNVALHEIGGNGLGSLNDAYCLEDYNRNTIMEGANASSMKYITKSDVKSIVAKYVSPDELSGLDEKIDNYIKNTQAYSNLKEKADFVKANFYEQIANSSKDLAGSKPEDFQFENIGNFCYKNYSKETFGEFDEINYVGESNSYVKRLSEDKAEMFDFNGFAYKGYNYNSGRFGLMNIDGMTAMDSGSFCVKYKDKIVLVGVKENELGEKKLVCNGIKQQESPESFDTIKRNVSDFVDKSRENKDYYFQVVTNSASEYLKNSGVKTLGLRDEYNLKFSTASSLYSFGENQMVNIYNDFDRDYKYKIVNGMAVLSSGEIVALTENGVNLLNAKFDFLNGKVNFEQNKITRSNYKSAQSQTQNTSSNMQEEQERSL